VREEQQEQQGGRRRTLGAGGLHMVLGAARCWCVFFLCVAGQYCEGMWFL
jgi:hypothetical protein